MTLVEMLVAITVLSAMILAVSSIMVQSQRFISITQASRRSHRLASSISRMIRSDLRRLSFEGFLCIAQADNGTPVLAFTTAGTSYTIAGDHAAGTGSIVCYGQVRNGSKDVPDRNKYQLLWRPAFVLTSERASADDAIEGSLADILSKSRDEISRNYVNEVLNRHRTAEGDISVPPGKDVDDIAKLWQILAKDCGDLSIMWTDGSLRKDGSNSIAWYGIDFIRGSGHVRVSAGDATIETNEGGYRALWTHHNQNNWPKAIKIRFRLRDPRLVDYLPAEMRREGHPFLDGYVYEVIATIRQ